MTLPHSLQQLAAASHLPTLARPPPVHLPPPLTEPQAEQVADPTDIFKFMHSNGIGEAVALFYMAWSYVLESRGNLSLADKVYKKGIHRCAPSRAHVWV